MKTFFALLMLIITVALICSPLYLIWRGIFSDIPVWGRIAMVAVGLVLCRLVKPVSVLTGKDYKYL